MSDGNMQSKQSTINNEACILVRRLGHQFRVLSLFSLASEYIQNNMPIDILSVERDVPAMRLAL